MTQEKNKITYLLGAGASAKALPMVKSNGASLGYTDSLRELSTQITSNALISGSYDSFKKEFCEHLNWVANKGDEYDTIDTFAKNCYIKGNREDLDVIKETLSIFFTIKQFIDGTKDKRYSHFITKLLTRQQLFPENIKILNWNYDSQMQIASSEFKKEEFFYSNMVTKHSTPIVPYYPGIGNEFSINASNEHIDLSMVHLNGIAGFYFYQPTGFILNYFLNDNLRDLNHLFEKVTKDRAMRQNLLCFAFERIDSSSSLPVRKRMDYAKKIIQETDYLVVIGYSFGIDNIEADEEIFKVLNQGNLKGIFIQNPYNNGNSLKQRFRLNSSINIEHITDLDTFYIPHEYKLSK